MISKKNHTFVVCAYKESPYLEACVKSLINQTVRSNIIMVTSTENDYIKKIAQSNNISLYIHDQGGIGKDWNFGLDQVNTQYVTLAHQDDIYDRDYTEKILEKMMDSEDALIAFCDYREIRNNEIKESNVNLKIKRVLLSPLKVNNRFKFFKRSTIAFGNAICCPAVTYNMKNLNGFRFEENWKTNLDWDAWERISLMNGKFIYIPEELMLHRIHEESETSNTIENNIRGKEDLIMLKRFWPNLLAKIIYKVYCKSEKSNQV